MKNYICLLSIIIGITQTGCKDECAKEQLQAYTTPMPCGGTTGNSIGQCTLDISYAPSCPPPGPFIKVSNETQPTNKFSQNQDSLYIEIIYVSKDAQACLQVQLDGQAEDTHCRPLSQDWSALDSNSKLSVNSEWAYATNGIPGFSFSGPTAINKLKDHPYLVPGTYTLYVKDDVIGPISQATFTITAEVLK